MTISPGRNGLDLRGRVLQACIARVGPSPRPATARTYRHAPHRNGHLPVQRHRGLDAASRGARRRALRRPARNDRTLLRDAFARHAGHDFGGAGDSMFVAFGSAQRRAARRRSMRNSRSRITRGPTSGRCACGWACIRARHERRGRLRRHRRAPRVADLRRGPRRTGAAVARRRTRSPMESREFALRDLGEHELEEPAASRSGPVSAAASAPAGRFPGAAHRRQARRPALPPQTTPHGRPRRRAACAARRCCTIRRCDLLTLTGPGRHAARRASPSRSRPISANEFPHGVYFVPLAAIDRCRRSSLPAIAHALGVSAARASR